MGGFFVKAVVLTTTDHGFCGTTRSSYGYLQTIENTSQPYVNLRWLLLAGLGKF
jgi:hypothetical protein